MTTRDALCVYCIDRSSSMGGLEEATAAGFNKFVEEQAAIDGTCYVSVVLFDDQIDVPTDPKTRAKFVAWNAKDMPQMTVPKDPDRPGFTFMDYGGRGGDVDSRREKALAGHRLPYYVRGSTAIRDAVATAIIGADQWLENHEWFDGYVIITTITDGQENASTQFTPSQLREMMEARKERGWKLVFQGGSTNWLDAADLRFDKTLTFAYDANTVQGTQTAYASNSVGVSNLRTTGSYT